MYLNIENEIYLFSLFKHLTKKTPQLTPQLTPQIVRLLKYFIFKKVEEKISSSKNWLKKRIILNIAN